MSVFGDVGIQEVIANCWVLSFLYRIATHRRMMVEAFYRVDEE